MKYLIEKECGLCGAPRHILEVGETAFRQFEPNQEVKRDTSNFTLKEVESAYGEELRDCIADGGALIKLHWQDTCSECSDY